MARSGEPTAEKIPASPKDYSSNPIATLKTGAFGTYHALCLAVEKRASFLLASTSEVYGDPLVSPQAESYCGNVNPVGPRSCYDEAKRYAEALTTAFGRDRGLKFRIVRIFNTYGPRMRVDDGRVVTNFITQALTGQPLTVYGSGTQTRSFQYVSDLVEGMRRLMEVEYCHPVNLGNPEEISILRLAETIRETTRTYSEICFLPLPEDDPKRRKPDITLATRLLDWRPEVSLQEGLEKTTAYFAGLLA